jgi:hypothetical protein
MDPVATMKAIFSNANILVAQKDVIYNLALSLSLSQLCNLLIFVDQQPRYIDYNQTDLDTHISMRHGGVAGGGGGSFNGGSFNGGSFNGGSFNGGSFNGGSFNGGIYICLLLRLGITLHVAITVII